MLCPPPSSVSLPRLPRKKFWSSLPVIESLKLLPNTYSMFSSVSLPAAPVAVPAARFTVTAPEAPT
ncbi:hypothetical protein D3C83_66350 [compost metagenome]